MKQNAFTYTPCVYAHGDRIITIPLCIVVRVHLLRHRRRHRRRHCRPGRSSRQRGTTTDRWWPTCRPVCAPRDSSQLKQQQQYDVMCRRWTDPHMLTDIMFSFLPRHHPLKKHAWAFASCWKWNIAHAWPPYIVIRYNRDTSHEPNDYIYNTNCWRSLVCIVLLLLSICFLCLMLYAWIVMSFA